MEFDASSATMEKGIEFPKLDMKKDEVARICIISTKGWVVSVRHWVRGVGYVHCHAMLGQKIESPVDLLKIEEEGGRPNDCILCANAAAGNERVGVPQRRFALRVLRYRTDMHGKASAGALGYWLEIWIIDNRKYRSLLTKMEEWGGKEKKSINKHDLLLTCEDEKYQNVTIDVMKSAWWEQDKANVKLYLKDELPKYDLMNCLGHSMEKEALERRFAFLKRRETPEAPVDLGAEEELVPGAVAKATSEDDPFDFESKGGDKSPEGEVPAVVDKEEAEETDFLDEVLDEKE